MSFHKFLIFFGAGFSLVNPASAPVFPNHLRQLLEIFIPIIYLAGNFHVFIHILVGRVRLGWAVRGLKTNRQAKGPTRLAVLEKFPCLLAHNLCQMLSTLVFREVPTLSGKTVPGVKFICGHIFLLFP
ncbi:hypothetical protein ES707_14402 [subsurface metagenome]